MALLLAALLSTTGLPAQAGGIATDMVRATVLGGWRTDAGTQMAALRLDLAEGWKTYWRAPGDAGIPPSFDWSGSENVASVRPHWPVPHVFELNGMRSIGYKQQLVLPLEVTPIDPRRPVRLNAAIDLGVCNDICVPISLHATAELPAEGRRDPLIGAALDDQPLSARQAGIARVTCEVAPIRNGLRLTASLVLPPPPPATGTTTGAADTGEVMVFETPDPSVWVSDSETRREGDRLIGTSDLIGSGRAPVMLDRSALRLTILGGRHAVEIRGCSG